MCSFVFGTRERLMFNAQQFPYKREVFKKCKKLFDNLQGSPGYKFPLCEYDDTFRDGAVHHSGKPILSPSKHIKLSNVV